METRTFIKVISVGILFISCFLLLNYTVSSSSWIKIPKYKSGSRNISSRRSTKSTEDFETMTLSNNVGTTKPTIEIPASTTAIITTTFTTMRTSSSTATKTLATSSPIPTPSQPENIGMKRLVELGSLNVSSRRPTRSTEDFETMTLSNNVGTTNPTIEKTASTTTTFTSSSTATKTLANSSPIPTPSQPENIEMKRLDELKSSIEKGSLHRTFIQSRPIEVGYIVPYKLHFIWITHPMPEKYLENLKTYRKYNDIYQIHLWLDDKSFESAKVAREEISNIVLHNISDLDMVDFYLFSKATNVGVKADILRYEVVWKEGGIYSDIDSVALKPFDSNFLHSFVMYTLDPYYNLSNAAFGFPKQSNFLKFVLSILEENFAFETYPPSLSGPGFLTSCFLAFNDSNINMINADYLVFHTKKSFTYHTNDANWMKEMQ